MHEETLTALLPLTAPRRASALQALARRLVLDKLARLQSGQLRVREAGRDWRFGTGEPLIQVEIRHPAFWPALAFGGTVGAGESFMAGDWDCEDLTGLVCLLLRNRPAMMDMEGGLARLSAPLRALLHRARRNDHAGSRRNIAAHYDLGNDFYRLWLDETLMYSSAVFERPDMTLAEASTAKLERICRKLALKPGDEVLEIGTGWGGFALHAAGRHGCRVTSLTLSQEQLALARERVAAAGLADRVEVRLCDYRDQQGQFDKLVSIEMVEAVGAEHLETYFRQCGRLLKPAGAMLLQAITIADQRYAAALKEVDFIQKHIFPGGFLPSVTALAVRHDPGLRPAYPSTWRTLAPTMPRPWPAGGTTSSAAWTPCADSASTRASSACGTSISVIARAVSGSGTWARCRCSWPSRAGATRFPWADP
jgi:cyclopropane-fatty-acyl-phospholipid synthase